MSQTKKQEEKVQVCENNLVRRIMAVKRVYKRRTDELRVVIVVKENVKTKLAKSSLAWACHGERIGDEKLAKRADAQKAEGTRRKTTEIATVGCLKDTYKK